MPKHVSVIDARLQQELGSTYVDVRSQAEFEQGHPAGSVNVPLLDRDARTGHVMPNPDFIRVMQANFPTDTKLLIGCQVGGRSMRAAQMLETFGYSDVTNVKGGFSGMRDPTGRSIEPGWAESGLPTESGPGNYNELAEKAGVDQ